MQKINDSVITNGNPKVINGECIVAFIDFLGTKEQLLDEKDTVALAQIITYIIDRTRKMAKKHGICAAKNLFGFSDNFALVIPSNDSESFRRLLLHVMCIQVIGIDKGIVMRGGISIGHAYIDRSRNFLLGNALVKAYQLEHETAKYPRIIIDKEVVKRLNKSLQNYLLKIDGDDGWSFLNYLLRCNRVYDEVTQDGFLEKHSLIIKNALEKYPECERKCSIRDKYLWMKKYHDMIVNEKSNANSSEEPDT